MKKLGFFLAVFILFSAIVSGCGKKDSQAVAYRAVTGVDIVTKQDGNLIQRHYTDPKKMQYVLTFLRLLKPVGKPDTDPEQITEDLFLIALSFSDGSRNYYRQAGHRYVAKNGEDWFSIDPQQAAGLYQLMAHMPSDEEK